MRFLIFLITTFFVAQVSISQELVVGSFNIRYDNPKDSGNLWKDRMPVVAALVRFHQFDVVGTQEGLRNQIDDLQQTLTEYTHYGLGRDDGKKKGEHSAIFFKVEKFNLLDKGDFWLSPTPEKPGPGWDARLNRICSWVKLQEKKSGKSFYFFNVHYDHQGVEARKESSKLILEKIGQIAGKEPVILAGDFNGDHQSEWYKTLAEGKGLKDSYHLASTPYVNNGSYNSFGKSLGRKEIIDHVFVSSAFSVNRYGILTDTYNGKFPSDHYPILVSLSMQ
jgi:endonuclease/exonuclease/phosphatase family metal-dependent hydrolase